MAHPGFGPHPFDGPPGVIDSDCRVCGAPITAPWHDDNVLPFGRSGAARTTDPGTAQKAATINQRWRNGQKFLLLHTHYQVALRDANYDGLTADGAAVAADLPVPCNGGTSKTCYWKRHSELWREYGFLRPRRNEVTGKIVERALPGGEPQMVLILTRAGVDHVEEVLRRFPFSRP